MRDSELITDSFRTADATKQESTAAGFQFVRHFIGWIVLFAILFLLVVVLVDTRRNYGVNLVPQSVPNTRRLKQELYAAYHSVRPVTGLIMGSSRTMLLQPPALDRLTSLRFFNAGVFVAKPEDLLAQYRLIRAGGGSVRKLVIGVDDFSLNDFDPYEPDLSGDYALMSQIDDSVRGPIGFLWHHAKLFKQSLTVPYVGEMRQSMQLLLKPKPPLYRYYPDGSMIQDQERRYSRDPVYADVLLGKLRRMDWLSAERCTMLETLLRETQRDGVAVSIFATPYHPLFLAEIQQDKKAWRNHLAAVQYLKSLGSRFGVRVADYTDARLFLGDFERWKDPVHYDAANALRLIERMKQDGL